MYSNMIERAAQAIAQADALMITAGAGMGIDSGLPDFRGKNGFWKAFPPLAHLGKSFVQMATPDLFASNPRLAWGFYGWRLNAYRAVTPHRGFNLLQQWAQNKPHGAFVFTSNVDGQFQKAGFASDKIIECHGSIHHLQCTRPCCQAIWSVDSWQPEINQQTCECENDLPKCPHCGGLARPNILMFGDGAWLPQRTAQQETNLANWLAETANKRVAIIELGAGTAIPSVRLFSEGMKRDLGATLIRINPDDVAICETHYLVLPMGALDALQQIDAHFQAA